MSIFDWNDGPLKRPPCGVIAAMAAGFVIGILTVVPRLWWW
jgi:hypothetical protein